jgi:hypothetical protein
MVSSSAKGSPFERCDAHDLNLLPVFCRFTYQVVGFFQPLTTSLQGTGPAETI